MEPAEVFHETNPVPEVRSIDPVQRKMKLKMKLEDFQIQAVLGKGFILIQLMR